MAWNQPGGNGSRDPWGDRGSQQGPPDLDEVLKKLQAALGRLFGGRGSGRMRGGGPGSDLGLGGKGTLLIVALILVVWLLWGIYIVEPPEQGVVLRFGEFVEVTEPGPHWVARPFYDAEVVNVDQIHIAEIGFRGAAGTPSTVPSESLMLTKDENIIDIQFAVLYRIADPAKYLFNVFDPDNTLRQATETAVREIVGRNTMDYIITEGRGQIGTEAQELIQNILDRYGTGILVASVNMQQAQPPREVQAAFDDAVMAREDEVRFRNEARAYKADIIPKARGEGEAIREEARAYKARVIALAQGETDRFLKVLAEYTKAPAVTRQRLYLESVESVIANSSKVFLDVEGANNLMYLPIDKLLERRVTGSGRGSDQLIDEQGASGSSFGDAFAQDREDERGRSRQ